MREEYATLEASKALINEAGTYNSLHIEVVSITVVPYYTVITRDVPVERDCNTITVLLLLLFQINNQSINALPDLLSLHTHLNTRLRIVD